MIATIKGDKLYCGSKRTNMEDEREDIEDCLHCEKPECTNCKQYVYFRAAWRSA